MTEDKKATLKKKAEEELRLMLVITVFLTAVFSRRSTTASRSSRRIVAKVILIGKAMGIGKERSGRRLMYVALRDSVAYAILVGIFAILEHIVEGLLHHKTLTAAARGAIDLSFLKFSGVDRFVFDKRGRG